MLAPTLTVFVAVGLTPVRALASPPVQSPGDDAATETETKTESEPEPTTAGEWYARGYELGNQGEYEGAADAFMRSYELQPTSEALFNAAVAHENASALVDAIEAYERFLAEPEPEPSLIPAAERSIELLMRQVGVLKGLRYDDTRPPAELKVDGEPVAVDEFPLIVMPGSIEIVVVDQAGTARSETYELFAGESLVLDLRALLPVPDVVEPEPDPDPVEIDPPETDPLVAAQARADERRARRVRTLSFSMTGVAGGSGIAALTLGLLANSARRRVLAQTCYEFPDNVCPPGFEPGDPGFHNRSYERYALGTAVMVGVTAGFAVTALVTGVISLRYAKRAAAGKPTAARVELGPSLGGLTLRF